MACMQATPIRERATTLSEHATTLSALTICVLPTTIYVSSQPLRASAGRGVQHATIYVSSTAVCVCSEAEARRGAAGRGPHAACSDASVSVPI